MSFFNRTGNQSSDSEDHEIWNNISELVDIKTILQKSEEKPQIIHKHSHRCSVSFLAKQELEGITEKIIDIADLYMINVIHQRDLSNAIASEFNIRHESPQLIILNDKKVIWEGSHWEIKEQDILAAVS